MKLTSNNGIKPARRIRAPRDNATLANSFRVWEELRAAGSDATFDGLPTVATREEVMNVLSDPELFISGGRLDNGSSREFIPQETDPPHHRRYRALLEPIFAPRQIRRMEPTVRAMAIDLIEKVEDAGSCDLVSTVGMLAPRFFIMELLGLPESRVAEVCDLKDEVLHPEGATDDERQAVKMAAGARIEKLLAEAMWERKENPGDDLLSQIIAMELDGDRLSDDEIQAIYYTVFIAGLDSVAAMTTMMFMFLAQNPAHRRQIVEDPTIIPNAVEELLRHQSVVETVARVASRDCVLNGRTLSAGDQVVVALGAANHDPAEFEDAGSVDFARNANKQVAFAAGIHRCLGMHLARLELAILLEEWHKRIPEYQIPEGTELEWIDSPVRMVRTLPLEWSVA